MIILMTMIRQARILYLISLIMMESKGFYDSRCFIVFHRDILSTAILESHDDGGIAWDDHGMVGGRNPAPPL